MRIVKSDPFAGQAIQVRSQHFSAIDTGLWLVIIIDQKEDDIRSAICGVGPRRLHENRGA
jgi:hypothetical protein